MTNPTLMVLNGTYAIHRFAPGTSIPKAIFSSPFYAVTATDEELSVVALDGLLTKSEKTDGGWSAIKVNGPLKLTQIGVLAGLSSALAEAGVSLFAISTFDTDYLLVKVTALDKARDALEAYTTSTGTLAHTVNVGPVTMFTRFYVEPSLAGNSITAGVQVNGLGVFPTGTVTISGADSAPCTFTLSAGSGSCYPVTFTTPGTKTITFTYSGDANYLPIIVTSIHIVN
jgi:uncharacterized protein